jgi:histidinol phosphatase-like PHP family hydrolase/predicted phosphodiesterase
MKIRIAVVTDIHSVRDRPPEATIRHQRCLVSNGIHAPGSQNHPERRGELAENLLLRVVNRFNRWIKPDITIIGGDVVDDCDSETACDWLVKIRRLLDKLACPYVVVRGNHDAAADYFYKVFDKIDQLDIKGYRLVIFDDPEEPNYCASRTNTDLQRFRAARADYNGPVISVQHTPLFPPGMSDCPYNYTNVEQIITEMRKYKVFLSVSGHYHKGVELINSRGINFITAPALCESPFSYMIIDAEDEKLSVSTDCFQMPPQLGLIDRHVHTQLAYCSENMDVASVMKLYRDFGLAGVIFTEHTGQLYFDKDYFFSGDFCINGLDAAMPKNSRIRQYFELMKLNNVPAESIGLEVDFDYSNRPIVTDTDKSGAGFFIGSIHKLAELRKDNIDWRQVYREFLGRTEAIVKSGVDVLGHPFRLFVRGGYNSDPVLFDKLIRLLKDNNVAVELNFHTQEPEIEFIEKCINSGVKLCLSSDSHNMYEVGELWPHLKMLEKIGISASDFERILL